MSDVKYNHRLFINSLDSHYTGSIVCFDGNQVVNQGKLLNRYSFMEIASCHSKVRIHRDDNLPMSDYIDKLKEISFAIERYVDHLERSEKTATLEIVK
jgi:hypothetical protein